MTTLLDVEELSVRFLLGPHGRHGMVSAVTDISLQLSAGQVLALVGESGCGKSVLAASLLGLLPANAEVRGRALLATGEGAGIELLGAPEQLLQSRVRGRLIGLVPQSAATHLTPVRRIAPQLTEALHELSAVPTPPFGAESRSLAPRRVPFGAEWRFRRRPRSYSEPNGDAVEQLVMRAGLDPDVLGRYPHELSGGMAQRVGVASALAGNPSVVLADEPTAGLDRPLVDRTVDQLAALAADGHAVLLITHDLRAARRVATDLAVMYASRIVEYGAADAIFSDPWHPYTRGLLAALPDRGFTAIPGDPPELTALPAGCAFRSRCPVRAHCTNTTELRRHGQRQLACHPAPC
ncbi:MAG TPA: ABC transporter ATP-binding protein [Pseudonocardiaceae bacterium]|nr:ABC transporter ATP-binding protein [Pseudonocardiaceae bacterium]